LEAKSQLIKRREQVKKYNEKVFGFNSDGHDSDENSLKVIIEKIF
jgi:hypothetical protein